MSYDIAFLHTAEVHVATFTKLVTDLDPSLKVLHVVDESLLDDARLEGLIPEVTARIEQTMQTASQDAPVVVCTCSTIGGIAELSGKGNFKSMRIDRAMADEAVNHKRVLIIAALESTLEPTLELLENSAERLKTSPKFTLLHAKNSWQYFEQGDNEAYWQNIADELASVWQDHDVIVIAQASMAKTAERCENISIPILSSPRLGVQAAIHKFHKLKKSS